MVKTATTTKKLRKKLLFVSSRGDLAYARYWDWESPYLCLKFPSRGQFWWEDTSDCFVCHGSSQGRGIHSDGQFFLPSLASTHLQSRRWPGPPAPGIRYTGTVLWAEARVSQRYRGPGGRVARFLRSTVHGLCCYARQFPLTQPTALSQFSNSVGKENGSPSNFLQGTSQGKFSHMEAVKIWTRWLVSLTL